MKKILSVLFLLSVLTTGAFAKEDISIQVFSTPTIANYNKDLYSGPQFFSYSIGGIAVTGNTYFVNIKDKCEIGLILDAGFYLSQTENTSALYFVPLAGIGSDKPDTLYWPGGFFSIGPCFNFIIRENASVYIAPVIASNFMIANQEFSATDPAYTKNSINYSIFTFGPEIGLGTKLWIGEHFGLTIGANAGFMVGGFYSKKAVSTKTDDTVSKYEIDIPLQYSFYWRARIGCIWRFGM